MTNLTHALARIALVMMSVTTVSFVALAQESKVAEIEETIAASALPAAAQTVISSKYPGAVIAKAEKTTEKSANGDKIGYEVIAKQGKKRITLEFDADGKVKGKAH